MENEIKCWIVWSLKGGLFFLRRCLSTSRCAESHTSSRCENRHQNLFSGPLPDCLAGFFGKKSNICHISFNEYNMLCKRGCLVLNQTRCCRGARPFVTDVLKATQIFVLSIHSLFSMAFFPTSHMGITLSRKQWQWRKWSLRTLWSSSKSH